MIKIMTDPEPRVEQESNDGTPLMSDVALPLATLPTIVGRVLCTESYHPKRQKSTISQDFYGVKDNGCWLLPCPAILLESVGWDPRRHTLGATSLF